MTDRSSYPKGNASEPDWFGPSGDEQPPSEAYEHKDVDSR